MNLPRKDIKAKNSRIAGSGTTLMKGKDFLQVNPSELVGRASQKAPSFNVRAEGRGLVAGSALFLAFIHKVRGI
jgi:hypothetical protein